jgi:hypothetical protein
MEKKLLKSQDDFDEWSREFGNYSNIRSLIFEFEKTPESFPCIAVWTEWDISGYSYDGGRLCYIYWADFE